MKNLDFGKKLAEVRKAKGLTQDEVAEMCSVTSRTIQRIESGEVTPRTFTIKAISETLGFDFLEASHTGYEAAKKSLLSTLKWYVTDLFNLKTHAMKKVSILATFCLAIGFAVFALMPKANAQPQKLPNYINTPELVEVAFVPAFTRDSLDFIKEDLAKRGIKVTYKKVKFDNAGRLTYINCGVDCGDDSGSFATGELLKASKKRFGFFRDYSKDALPTFAIGCINCNSKCHGYDPLRRYKKLK